MTVLQVMELGAGTLGEVVSSGELPAHLVATSPSVRDLSAACAVHAYAVSVYVEHMAVDAAAVLRNDDAMLRAVLLPLLQGSAAAGPFVAARSAAAVTALCKCAPPAYCYCSESMVCNLCELTRGREALRGIML